MLGREGEGSGVERQQGVELPGREAHALQAAPGLDVDEGQGAGAQAASAARAEGAKGFPDGERRGGDAAEQEGVDEAGVLRPALQVGTDGGAVAFAAGQFGFALRSLDQLLSERLIKRSRCSSATLTWSRSQRRFGSL